MSTSEPAKDKHLQVFVPEGFTDFRCKMCGECCREPERILVSASKAERLLRVLQESNFSIPARDAVTQERWAGEESASFALVGDRCVFLTGEGRCRLCELGAEELRGLWCISFPVSPIVTPRGVNYAISFACARAAELLQRREPLHILAVRVSGTALPVTERPFTARHQIPTIGGRPRLDWSGLRLMEGMLLAVARDWKIPLADRLVVMVILLNRLLEGYEGPASEAALRVRVSRAARELHHLVDEARTFGPDRAAHYEALAAVFGRRIGLRTQARLRKMVDESLRQVRGRRTKMSSADLGATLAELYSRHYRPKARRFEHVLGNYVICRLFASREMLTGGVYKGVYAVCYLAALVRFFATTGAAARGTTVDEAGVVEAIRFVDKLFAQGRNVFDFLDADGEQARMADPGYAAALVRI